MPSRYYYHQLFSGFRITYANDTAGLDEARGGSGLSRHILEDDRDYVPFFLSRGVKASYGKRSWLDRIFHR